MLKKSTIIILIVIAAIIAGGVSYEIFKPKKSPYEFTIAKKQDILQEVSVTGKVKPSQDVDLAFEKSGKVNKIYIGVGDQVKSGQVLAILDNVDLSAQLAQAQAQVEVQQAALQKLQKGARPEEIEISQVKVTSAQQDINDAQIALVNTKAKASTDLENLYLAGKEILQDAYAKADDAINKQIDDLFTNDASVNPQLTYSVSNLQLENTAKQERVLAGTELSAFKNELADLTSDQSKLDQNLVTVKNHLIVIRNFLSNLNESLNWATGITQTTISTYKGYVNTARTNVNTALTNIDTQQQEIAAQKNTNQTNINTAEATLTSAENALELAQKQLILDKAGPTKEQLQEQEAQVRQAEANQQNIAAQLAKTILHSPIDGIVSRQDLKLGEIISANTIVISVISQNQFQIEANVPEADIAKIQVGNPAKITLDAYGNDIIFQAKLISIDPAETIVEGVSTYKITLQFDEENEKIKSGMTANIDILAAEKDNVLAVPSRAIITRNGDRFVKVLGDKNKTEERKVILGLKGSDGNTEILSGLQEREKVVTFENK